MAPALQQKPAVEYYFDTSCPWSYLALERLRDAALRTGPGSFTAPFWWTTCCDA